MELAVINPVAIKVLTPLVKMEFDYLSGSKKEVKIGEMIRKIKEFFKHDFVKEAREALDHAQSFASAAFSGHALEMAE